MTFYWILWGFDAIISIIIIGFFFWGLADGSVSSYNFGMWMLLLLAVAVIMGGSLLLKANNHLMAAKILLWVMALPGLIGAFFILVLMVTNPRWN